MIPARCELCRFADKASGHDDRLLCRKILDNSGERVAELVTKPAYIEALDLPPSTVVLNVAPSFCCSLFEVKPK